MTEVTITTGESTAAIRESKTGFRLFLTKNLFRRLACNESFGGRCVTWTLNPKVIATAWGFFVAVMFVVGAVSYFNNLNNNHRLDFDALRSFLPAVLALALGLLYSLAGGMAVLFEDYGLPAILFLLAFLLFWLFLALGALAHEESDRGAYFGIAGTAGGFVFGIPIGGWRPAKRQTRGGRAQNGGN